jgi:molybdopterin converting factor subunit 1
MTIHILAFGIAKEIFDNSSIDIELEEETKIDRLKFLLEEKYPALKKLGSYMIAVNKEYAADDLAIHEKDEIAFIPPVSGG